jgi:hypothetical protein
VGIPVKGERMKPIPDISRRSVLRALTASATAAGAALTFAAPGSAVSAAPGQVPAAPEAGQQPSGHHHLIGVL